MLMVMMMVVASFNWLPIKSRIDFINNFSPDLQGTQRPNFSVSLLVSPLRSASTSFTQLAIRKKNDNTEEGSEKLAIEIRAIFQENDIILHRHISYAL